MEARETSLVWNYKHADVEFGRLQARDLLQVSLAMGLAYEYIHEYNRPEHPPTA